MAKKKKPATNPATTATRSSVPPVPHGKGPLDTPTYADLIQSGLMRDRAADDDK